MNFVQAFTRVSDIPNNLLDECCNNLIEAMPNGGKLYKYRSLIGESYDNTYDSLENGYLWISSVDALNDDFDSILFGDALSCHRRIVDYLCNDKDKFLFFSLKKNGATIWDRKSLLAGIPIEEFLNCFDENNFALVDGRILAFLRRYFYDESSQKKALNEIQSLLKESIILPYAESFALETNQYNKNLCNRLHVFSMSDSYDLDNMWGYYSDSGKGFCIEYDFGKILDLPDDSKKVLLNTYKVQYSKSPKLFDIEAYVEASFFENASTDVYKRLTSSIVSQIITKDITWEHENEWRIVLGDIEPKVFIDMVSGIIIDRRSLNDANAKKLIVLGIQRGWNIKVRDRSFFDGRHYFVDYNEYIKGANEK